MFPPVKVLPLTAESVRNAYTRFDTDTVVLSIPGYPSPTDEQVQELAKTLVAGGGDRALLVCLEEDCAKALGHAIRLLDPGRACLCIDRVRLQNESFLDIGAPIGPALPVVVKTLVLSQN